MSLTVVSIAATSLLLGAALVDYHFRGPGVVEKDGGTHCGEAHAPPRRFQLADR
jgi:hypothetical protein